MPSSNEPQTGSVASGAALRHALAEYEAARIRYREVVLASLDGRADGAAIRAAIDGARAAHAALARCRSASSHPDPAPRPRNAWAWMARFARRATAS